MNKIKNWFKSVGTYLKENELVILYILFGGALITANCIANKMIYVGNWFGEDIRITMGIICYPFTFLLTDIIGEKFGKKAAFTAVVGGFIGQIISMILIFIGMAIPGNIFPSDTTAESYRIVFGNGCMLILGSLIGCLVSQTWDVWIFHKIRAAYIKKHGTTKGGKWIWNNVGTITSQLIDSAIFYGIAFGFSQGMTLTKYFITILVYWLIKTCIALLDTPFFYLFTRGTDKKVEEEIKAHLDKVDA